MMSLVATPIVAARVAAPKKVRTQTVAKASSADQAKSSAVAGALALTMLAQPALAMNELGQIADKQSDAKALAAAEFAELQVKKKAPAAPRRPRTSPRASPRCRSPPSPPPPWAAAPSPRPRSRRRRRRPPRRSRYVVFRRSHCRERERGRARARARARSAPHRDDDVERDRVAVFPDTHDRSIVSENVVSLCPLTLTFRFRPRSERPQGQGKLGFAMAILFSPLLAVAGLSLQTLLRVVPQAAEGKDFFPKDTMPF